MVAKSENVKQSSWGINTFARHHMYLFVLQKWYKTLNVCAAKHLQMNNIIRQNWHKDSIEWTEKRYHLNFDSSHLFHFCFVISTILIHIQTHTFSPAPWFLLNDRKRRGRGEREGGCAISFRVLGHLIGSWQHMELWGRFAHAHFWGNKYLPEGEQARGREKNIN